MRNADEAFLFLSRLARRLEAPGRDFLAAPLAGCRRRRQEERDRLRPALATWLEGPLGERFSRAVRRPVLFAGDPRHPAFLPVADFARAALAPQASEIPQLLPAALREGEIEAQHRLRIAVKHFRYRAEILSPLLGSGFRPLHAKLKGYQDELGKMHDLDVFAALLAEEPPGPGRDEALAAIAAERREHFRKFAVLHAEMPLPEVGYGCRDYFGPANPKMIHRKGAKNAKENIPDGNPSLRTLRRCVSGANGR